MECYRCGQEGHARSACPTSVGFPPALGLPPAPDRSTPIPPPPPLRRSEDEIADPRPWAERVRRQMGWGRGQMAEELRRALAMKQVSESRADRFVT